MIPILYDALEKDFTTNGIGFLTDAVSCIVTEERNGIYAAMFGYDNLYKQIMETVQKIRELLAGITKDAE